MSMREKTKVGEVMYGFAFFSPDAWIFSGTRQPGLHHHITCGEESALTAGEAPLQCVIIQEPHHADCGFQLLGERRFKEKGAIDLCLVSFVDSKEHQSERLTRLSPIETGLRKSTERPISADLRSKVPDQTASMANCIAKPPLVRLET